MDTLFNFLKKFERFGKNIDLLIAAGLLSVLAIMLIPMPPILLDLALTVSLTLSLLILIVSIYTEKPLDFSVFPSLLLITTLFRLSLNVASTRLILTEGHQGGDAAGDVISAFGNFVVGGNYIIGLIVFIILVIINFIVITKGSGRVAEVAARFTLDAMPGKQMSIDADLNSGLISEGEARARRKQIESEADFYGAMDGASKFVRGDAIAGIIITVINIVGGLLIGVLQRGMDISLAAQNYTMLTIGDGLVSQIPALIISTAAGMVVTRNVSEKNMGQDVVGQLFLKSKNIYIVAGVLILLSLIPGLPTAPFLFMGLFLAGIAWFMSRNKDLEEQKKSFMEAEAARKPKVDNFESMLPLDLVALEVGYGLINVVESEESGDLLERIVSIRKQFAVDLGIVIPSIHIRDNLQLAPGEYQVLIRGNKVAGGSLRTDCYLAMDPGETTEVIEGMPAKEPVFGLDALWIAKGLKEEADLAGYTVVDLPTVMATHITEVLRSHSHELVGRQEVDRLVENLKGTSPKVVEELIPGILPFGLVVRVLQGLLKEQVSIRDLLTVFETLADEGGRTKDPDELIECVRRALARSISLRFLGEEGEISVLALGPRTEELISQSLLQTEQGIQLVMDPSVANGLVNEISKTIEELPEIAGQPILLTSPTSRRHIFKLTSRFIPQLSVIAHSELVADVKISTLGVVEGVHAS